MDKIKQDKLEAIDWNVSDTDEFLHLTAEDVIIIEEKLREMAEQNDTYVNNFFDAFDEHIQIAGYHFDDNSNDDNSNDDNSNDEATHSAEIQRMCRECTDNLTCPFAFEKGCV